MCNTAPGFQKQLIGSINLTLPLNGVPRMRPEHRSRAPLRWPWPPAIGLVSRGPAPPWEERTGSQAVGCFWWWLRGIQSWAALSNHMRSLLATSPFTGGKCGRWVCRVAAGHWLACEMWLCCVHGGELLLGFHSRRHIKVEKYFERDPWPEAETLASWQCPARTRQCCHGAPCFCEEVSAGPAESSAQWESECHLVTITSLSAQGLRCRVRASSTKRLKVYRSSALPAATGWRVTVHQEGRGGNGTIPAAGEAGLLTSPALTTPGRLWGPFLPPFLPSTDLSFAASSQHYWLTKTLKRVLWA